MNNAEVLNALEACMIKDRFRFKKKLQRQKNKNIDPQLRAQIDASIAIAQQRKSSKPIPKFPEQLPVSQRVDDIKNAISKHQVTIVAGETGSGKTTQIPKICLAMGRGVHGLIGHTQPRRVAARTVAHRIAEELNVKFGESVGYQVRFTDKSSPSTHIKVMTDGILLAETQHDKYLEKYDTIIIDEAHERSLNIDFLLGYLKQILPKRPDLKVIITSATIDVNRFSKHFSNAPVIEVSGRTYAVDVLYRPLEELDSNSDNNQDNDELMYLGIIEALREISVLEKGRGVGGDVLIFLSGEREIREVAQAIRKAELKNFNILPLYSRLSVTEQNRVFRAHSDRRIVLATNVAETSLTVPGIRYVIDPGFARISRYSVRSKVQQLPIEPISRASADQRKGRCGRVSEGVCFRLYAEDDFLSRPEFMAPEILRTNLASVILQMLSLKLGDISKFPFVENPEQRQINDGYQLLFELKAVDKHRKLTTLGREMARLPIDLKLGRMLLEARELGCVSELLIIVSALAVQDPRERPHEHQQAADEKHRQYWHEQSDFMALLNLWKFFEENRQALNNNQFRKFCRRHYLSYMRILEWRENHRQLHLLCKELKLRENREEASYLAIHSALLAGLIGNIGEKTNENEYLGTRNRRHFIFPGSSQFKRKPKWIMSGELVETTRLFARMVAQIESEWIEPLAQHVVKRNYHEPFFDIKSGRVMAFEEVLLHGVVIVKKRKVDFGKVDVDKARHLFIQDGLVEQQVLLKAGFYRHNTQLIANIEKLESKSRKRDILVSPYAVFQFYDALLPETITSVAKLNAWRKESEIEKPKLLYLDQSQLMKQDADLPEALYPDKLEIAETKLKLDYHFDPQHEDDGVSLNVPVSILRQVSKAQLDWVIPGLLEEKCLALIKSLPKAIRKKFVPAPEYAKKVTPLLEFDGRELPVVLAEKLFRMTGTQVDVSAFKVDVIDEHLHMNIKVLDDKGRVLASDRNLEKLRTQFQAKADAAFKNRNLTDIECTGLTDWSFDELPERIEVLQGAIKVMAFPALVDKGATVAIEIFDNELSARRNSELGLLKLLMLVLKDQVKYIEKNIPDFERFALFYVNRGTRQALLDDVVGSIFRANFIEEKASVRNKAAFSERLTEKKSLVTTMNAVAKLLKEILQRSMAIEACLKQRRANLDGNLAADIKSQMLSLMAPQFLQSVPMKWLRHYPRFLKAIEHRLEKGPVNIQKDGSNTHIIQEFWRRLDGQLDVHDQNKLEFRWLIEELRVSLFAQSLGTSQPISAKRLEKVWKLM